MSEKANFRALLPMIVFLVLFIGTGIALTAAGAVMPFYQLSATVQRFKRRTGTQLLQ